jgi:hypothetical protein
MMFRILLLILIGFEAIVCAFLLIAGIAAQWEADGISRGVGAVYAIAATLIFLLFVFPAFVFVKRRKSLVLATFLTLVPLALIIWVLEPWITGSQWYISRFVWR